MLDYKDILKQFKEELEPEKNKVEEKPLVTADTMDMIEGSNARISSDSKKYKEGNKYIFKQHISYESANDIVSTITEVASVGVRDLLNYKDDIYQKALYSFEQGENPVEMIIYSTKALSDDLYKDAVLDKLKDLVLDFRADVVMAYKNILTNWSFDDCVELVLKSISQSMITELGEEVFKIFETRYSLREKAAQTLVDLDIEDKFESIVNFLAINNNESNEENQIFRDVLRYLGKNNERGTLAIYKVYKTVNGGNVVRNILAAGIREHVTNEIYDDMEILLQDSKTQNWVTNRILNFINRQKNSKRAVEIAKKCKDYTHVDISKLDILVDSDYTSLIKSINNKNESYAIRRNSIIRLAKLKNIDTAKRNEFLFGFNPDIEKLDVVKSSALVEIGVKGELIELLRYFVGATEKELSDEAMHQIKRLRATQNTEIDKNLLGAISRFLDYDDEANVQRIEMLIDLYYTGIQKDDVGMVFLNKLKNTQHKAIKRKLLMFFSKNYYNFSSGLKTNIKNQIIQETNKVDVHSEAMEALKKITVLDTSIPESI